MARRSVWLAAPLALAAGVALAGPGGAAPGAHLGITVWTAPVVPASLLGSVAGGATYGGAAPSGALIEDVRSLDVPASGELRITGLPATLDAGSVLLRASPDVGLVISEQRFSAGATSATDILARHAGGVVTVTTPKGEVTGVLRSVDADNLVIEVGAGDQRHFVVLRRDGFVQEVRLPDNAGVADRATLAWKVTATKPGQHPVALTYRAAGMSWVPEYVAVLDETAGTVELGARATIRNATGATFDDAEVTLVAATGAGKASAAARFVVPAHVHLGAGETVQVDLVPPHAVAKARQVVTYTSLQDSIINAILSQEVQADCAQLATGGGTAGHAELGVEVDVANQVTLPEGRARLFRRSGGRVDVVSEDTLRASPGIARVRIANVDAISADRKQISCIADEVHRRLEEKIEVTVANKGPRAQDVVVRELAWRYPIWTIDPKSESHPGARAGTNAQEYRVHVGGGGGTQRIAYTVVYSW